MLAFSRDSLPDLAESLNAVPDKAAEDSFFLLDLPRDQIEAIYGRRSTATRSTAGAASRRTTSSPAPSAARCGCTPREWCASSAILVPTRLRAVVGQCAGGSLRRHPRGGADPSRRRPHARSRSLTLGSQMPPAAQGFQPLVDPGSKRRRRPQKLPRPLVCR